MPDAHALLGASSAHCWGKCVAAPRAQKGLTDRGSRDADEGTAVHDLSAWALINGKDPADYPDTHIDVHGTKWKITKEMQESSRTYVTAARKEAEGGTLLVEQKVVYGPLIFGGKDMFFDSPEGLKRVSPADVAWGTSDTIILKAPEIRIKDFKNGANPNNIVEAEDNEQLRLYLLGALYEYEQIDEFTKGHMSISQPRLKHAPECEISIDELREWGKQIGQKGRRALELYYREAEPELSDYTPGPACKWCKRKATCPALQAEVEHETRDLFAALVEHGASAMAAAVPEDRLAQAMSKVSLLEDFTKAIRAETERRLLAGQPVEGWKLVEGRRGPRAWADKDAAEAAFKSMRLKVDEMYDYEIRSPTTMEKVLKDRPKLWKKAVGMITQSDGKPSVAPDSDKRPALKVNGADALGALASAEDMV